MYDCVIVQQFRRELCGWKTAVHVSMCHTQFDFSILCEQNILSFNVSVNHMMGVKMGKTLEDIHTNINTNIHSQMTYITTDMKSQTLISKEP